MKIRAFLLKLLIFTGFTAFYIVPPFFVKGTEVQVFTQWNFPLFQIIFSFFIFLLFFRILPYLYGNNAVKEQFFRNNSLKNYSLSFVFVLALLFLASIFCVFVMRFLHVEEHLVTYSRPENLFRLICMLLTFASAAFNEEAVFRFYVPFFFLSFTENKKIRILIEICCIVVFAFEHIYAGYFAVLNAFLSGIVLRFFFRKTGSVLAVFPAHFVYNVITLYLNSN